QRARAGFAGDTSAPLHRSHRDLAPEENDGSRSPHRAKWPRHDRYLRAALRVSEPWRRANKCPVSCVNRGAVVGSPFAWRSRLYLSGSNVLQRTTLECPSGHPSNSATSNEAELLITAPAPGSCRSTPRSVGDTATAYRDVATRESR